MNKDLIIGLIVSTSVHGGLILTPGPDKHKDVAENIDAVELIELPQQIQDETPPDATESDSAEAEPIEFAPPMTADVPSTVPTATFQQRLQAPPPPSTPTARGEIKIPVNRTPPKSNMANLIDLKDLDQRPQATYQVQPQFPYEMKRQGITGKVVLGFIVDSQGYARDIYVVSSTHTEFEQPAIQALQKWKFRPGKKNGKVVNTRNVQQPISFNLTDNN
jgi:periplasmic protein TonB